MADDPKDPFDNITPPDDVDPEKTKPKLFAYSMSDAELEDYQRMLMNPANLEEKIHAYVAGTMFLDEDGYVDDAEPMFLEGIAKCGLTLDEACELLDLKRKPKP